MPQTYRRHGLSLTYPATWELQESSEPHQVTLGYELAGTAFWSLTLFFDRPDRNEVAQATLEAFRSEYPELDIYETRARVGRRDTVAFDLDFLCLEMTNSARVRVFDAPRFTGLIIFQGTDPEFEPFAARCEQVSRSIRCYRPGSEERRSSQVSNLDDPFPDEEEGEADEATDESA